MRADTASITTPAKPERNFAVTTAIVPVTTAIAQSKKKEHTFGNRKTVEKKNEKNERKKNEKKKETKKNTKKSAILVASAPLWEGGPGNSQKETLGSLPYKNHQEPPQGKLWGCQKLQNGIFGKPQQIW